jgi:hypothetical protein
MIRICHAVTTVPTTVSTYTPTVCSNALGL